MINHQMDITEGTVDSQLPVYPNVPFVAFDLACIVCTVQIKFI